MNNLWFAASIIGLPLVPPFLDPATKGTKVLQGVNYASAGSGILNSTGEFFVSTLFWLLSLYSSHGRFTSCTYISPFGLFFAFPWVVLTTNLFLSQGQLITTSKQLEYFRDQTLPEIHELLGEEAADKLIHESVYYMISGSNDFVNGYYFYIPTSPPEMSIDDFIQLVVDTLSQQLKVLACHLISPSYRSRGSHSFQYI